MSAQQLFKEQDESRRLAAVRALQLLDTDSEPEFDEVVALAALLCGASKSTVTILDQHRQWYKARVGVEACETPISESICVQTIGTNEPLVIPDTLLDVRYRHHPAVVGGPKLRFYAGMPLNTSKGLTVGTLCVMDTVPRELNQTQIAALTYMGRQVSMLLELRAKNKLLSDAFRAVDRTRAELRNANRLFRAFMDHSPILGFMKDAQGRILYYNRPFQERFQVAADEWIGKEDLHTLPPQVPAGLRQTDPSLLNAQTPIVTEDSSPTPEGGIVYWRTYQFPVVRENGERLVAGLSLDISREKQVQLELERSHEELRAANARLTELSMTDQLTRLRNRRAFDLRLEQECQTSNATGLPLSLLMLDVDHFKRINDAFGHAAGDDVLSSVGRVLVGSCRTTDIVARYGGEEFAILLPNTQPAAAAGLAQRILRTIESHPWRRGSVTVSIGVASWSALCPDPASLAAHADAALYEAKKNGRNRVEVAASAKSTAMLA